MRASPRQGVVAFMVMMAIGDEQSAKNAQRVDRYVGGDIKRCIHKRLTCKYAETRENVMQRNCCMRV